MFADPDRSGYTILVKSRLSVLGVDEIVKLMLASAVSFSLITISFQLMRLIGKLADSIQDLRKALQNVSEASDLVLSDYQKIRKIITAITNITTNFNDTFIVPAKVLADIFGSNKSDGKGDQDEDSSDSTS